MKQKNSSIVKKLIMFSIPLVLSGLLQQLFNWADAFVLGNVEGELALAAIGATTAFVNLIVNMLVGFTSGLSILSARFYGTGEHHKQKKILGTFMSLLLTVMIVVSVLGILLSPAVFRGIHTPESICDGAVLYMQIIFLGMPLLTVYNIYSAILRGIGDSRSPFQAIVAAGIINMVLDVLLVAVFHFEIAGAAGATVLSQGISAVIVVFIAHSKHEMLQFKKTTKANVTTVSGSNEANVSIVSGSNTTKRDTFTSKDRKALFSKVILAQGFALAVPITIQSMINGLGGVVLQNFMNGFGEATVAAITTSYRVDTALLLPVVNLGTGIATMVSQCVGARDEKRANSFFKVGLFLMLLFAICMSIFIWFFGGTVVAIFGVEAEAVAIGAAFFKRLGAFYVIFGIVFALSGYLEGHGDVVYTSVVSIACLGIRIILSYVLVGFFANMVIAWAEVISWGIWAAALYVRYLTRSRWMK